MAEAVVSFVVERVGELLIQEANFLGGVRGQVEEMQMELKRMQLFLQDADTRQEQSKSVQGWVSEIRDVAYDAEDVIETFALEVMSRKEKGFANKCKRYTTTIFNEGAKVHKVGKEIESIRGRITSLTTSLQTYGIQVKEEGEGSSSSRIRVQQQQQQLRRSYSHLVEELTVGLDVYTNILVAKLVTDDDGNQTSQIVSICGMGGLGKTTLANKLYHHHDVRHHFDAFAWACISQQFKTRHVVEEILIKLVSPSTQRREEISKMKNDEIAKELHQVQQEKKCLVILDDIWKEEDWDALKHAFPIGKLAGTIILTTRNKAIAFHADPRAFLHEPQTLNEEEGWELLQKKAFSSRDYPGLRISIEMEKLGRKMVKRCAGLPLAITVLGGLLATKQCSLGEWNKVHENVDLYLRRGKGQDQEYSAVDGVLVLSYHELPYHLKPCFLHLGHFPEDYDIPSKTLFRLWVAEGLVRQTQLSEGQGTETMEDLAECYLGELIDRCMVLVGKMGSTGRVKTCRIHDLMRDMCLSKGNQENFLEIVRAQNMNERPISRRARRFVVYADGQDFDLKYYYARTPSLRSLLFFGSQSHPRLISMFNHFQLLKILRLVNCTITVELTKEIGYLIHLRYLAFENCYIGYLPPSIGNLKYLQTLYVHGSGLVNIPDVLWKFEQMRNLKLNKYITTRGRKLLKLGNMRKLQTLCGFSTRTFDVAELVNFSELKKLEMTLSLEFGGTMRIPSVCLLRLTSLYITNWTKMNEAELERIFLWCHHHLQKLSYEGVIEKLPEYYHFPPNLTKLTLINSQLMEDPMAILEKLPNLAILNLLCGSFMGCLLVCSSKGFPRLKTLVFDNLDSLHEWRVDEEAMSSLCELCMSGCQELRMVPDGIKFITTLRHLEIKHMSFEISWRLQVKEGREGEDVHKVRHVPSIILEDNIF